MTRFTSMVMPAYWASYLINGDASSMTETEVEDCDSYIEQQNIRVIHSEGQAFFGRFPYGGLSGDLLEYVVEEL